MSQSANNFFNASQNQSSSSHIVIDNLTDQVGILLQNLAQVGDVIETESQS